MAYRNRVSSIVIGALVLASSAVYAQPAERLTDDAVKQVFESVNQARDRFEDQLDGRVKNSVVRSASGETQVSTGLDDFQEAVDRLKSRFTDNYAASAEAEVVLRRGTWFGTMMASQPPDLKGASEWDQLRGELGRLAAVYGTQFPLAEGAAVRRINDGEAAAVAGTVASQAEQIKRAANAEKTFAKPEKQALEKDVEAVVKQAKTLQSRLKDGKPATSEAKLLKEKVTGLTPAGRQLPPSVLTAIGGLRAPLDKLDQAFGVDASR